MREWKPGEECEHGRLGRKCELCASADEVEELNAANAALHARVKALEARVAALTAALWMCEAGERAITVHMARAAIAAADAGAHAEEASDGD